MRIVIQETFPYLCHNPATRQGISRTHRFPAAGANQGLKDVEPGGRQLSAPEGAGAIEEVAADDRVAHQSF